MSKTKNNNVGCYNLEEYNIKKYNIGSHNNGFYNIGNYNNGHYNIGHYNNGHNNIGNCNIGDYNSGYYNNGYRNSGDFNKTRYSNGCFNTLEHKIYLFDKPSKFTYTDWILSPAFRILKDIPPQNKIVFIRFDCMTDEEKEIYPDSEKTDGYFKKIDNKKAVLDWWASLSYEDKNLVMSIPNFDKEIFKEITGIDVDEKQV